MAGASYILTDDMLLSVKTKAAVFDLKKW